MAWFDSFARNLGTQVSPFGFAPTGSPTQGPVDPAYNAGMQYLGDVGLRMLASGSKKPLQAFGEAAMGARADASTRNKEQFAAQQMLQQAEDAKRKREEEIQKKAEFDSFIETLPADQQGLARMFPEKFGGALIDRTLPAPATGSNASMGMTPIPLRDKEGNWAVGQLSPNGGVYVDGQPAGEKWIYDPYGLNAEKSRGTTVGKGRGNAEDDYSSLASKMPGLEKVVTQLDGLAKEATYTAGGQLWNTIVKESGFGPTDGAVARTKYEAIVNNQILPLLRDTFGAQFTLQEGRDLRATLGDPNKTPEEKQAVLNAFIDQKVRDLEALGVQSGKLPPPDANPDTGGGLPVPEGWDPEDWRYLTREEQQKVIGQ